MSASKNGIVPQSMNVFCEMISTLICEAPVLHQFVQNNIALPKVIINKHIAGDLYYFEIKVFYVEYIEFSS